MCIFFVASHSHSSAGCFVSGEEAQFHKCFQFLCCWGLIFKQQFKKGQVSVLHSGSWQQQTVFGVGDVHGASPTDAK